MLKEMNVYAYANKEEFEKFIKLGYNIELLSLPSETATGLTMSENIKDDKGLECISDL